MRAECGHHHQVYAVRERLTVPIDVCGAGISFPVVVRVSLIWVVVVGAVVTAVSNLILVVVKLPGVEEKLAVVLQKGKGRSQDTAWGCTGLQVTAACRADTLAPRAGQPRPRFLAT